MNAFTRRSWTDAQNPNFLRIMNSIICLPVFSIVERFFNNLKQYRGIATRFDKLATTFLAGVLLVCVLIWLN